MSSARELLAELEALLPTGRASRPDDACPYTGLASFKESDEGRFFGREREVLQAVSRLADAPLLAVVGPSGAGKSSFVRAGVIPALKRGGEAWEAFTVRPGPRPLAALAELLLQGSWQSSTANDVTASDATTSAEAEPALPAAGARDALGRRLAEEPGFFGASLRARARRKRERIALVVDQLEEAVTLVGEPEREAFFHCLAGVADDAGSPLRLIVSLRADFLDRFAGTRTRLVDLLGRGMVLLQPLDRDGLHRALVKPAEAAELRFESDALVAEILDALATTSGAMPLVQFTATKLWEARDQERRLLTTASYRRLGGVAGALAGHADMVLSGMTRAEKSAARAVFLRLVTPERTRALVPLSELRALGAVAGADMGRVLDRLIDARLLTVGGGGAEEGLVELVHESLLEAWPTLQHWLEESEGDAAFMARLVSAAADWERSGRLEGLLWRAEAAAEAARWDERRRSEGRQALAPREEAYLTAVRKLGERARRGRRLALGGAFAALALVAASTSLLAWKQHVANRAAKEAAAAANAASDKAQAASTRALLEARRGRDAARMAALAYFREDATEKLALLREIEGPELPPHWLSQVWMTLSAPLARVVLEGHRDGAACASWSPDGRYIATGAFDKQVRIWRADGRGEPRALQGHEDRVWAVTWSPDGKRIATGSEDKTLRVWNLEGTQDPLVLVGHHKPVVTAAWSPDGEHIATGSEDGTARVWRADGKGEPTVLAELAEPVTSVAWSRDSLQLVVGSEDKNVRVFRVGVRGAPLVLRGHTDAVESVAVSPDGRRIASASNDKTVRLWSADGRGEPRVLSGHRDTITSVSFSPDGRRLASGSNDGSARLWNIDGESAPLALTSHRGGVSGVAWSPDGLHLASSSFDGTVRVWDIPPPGLHGALAGHTRQVTTVAISPDGARIASGSADGTVRLWRADGSVRVLIGQPEWVLGLAFRPDGARLATAGSNDGAVRLFDVEDGKLLARLPSARDTLILSAVTWSPEGARVAAGGVRSILRVYLDGGAGASRALDSPEEWIRALAWSPDGEHLAVGDNVGSVRIVRADGSGEAVTLRGHESTVWSVAYSRDGVRLASASADRTVRIWRVDGSAPPLVLRGHTDDVHAVRWTRGDTQLVTGSTDGTVRLWKADGTGEPIVIGAHNGAVRAVAVSPDGARVISTGGDKLVRIWTDFEPLSLSSARLWRATGYCLHAKEREDLLGIPAEDAGAQEQACRRRVAEALATPEGGSRTPP